MSMILYACERCWEAELDEPAACYDNPNDLRVMPDGSWLCANCFVEVGADHGAEIVEGKDEPMWSDFAPPPTYVPEK